MSEKTFEPAEWPFAEKMAKFIEETDTRLYILEAQFNLHREQTVAAFKEMGFDFDKVKVRTRVPQDQLVEKECLACRVPVFEKHNSDRYLILVNSDGSMHICVEQPFLEKLRTTAPVEPSIDASSTQQEIKEGVAVDLIGDTNFLNTSRTRKGFAPNAGASVDGDPRQPEPGPTPKPLQKKAPAEQKMTPKWPYPAQSARNIISAGGAGVSDVIQDGTLAGSGVKETSND